MNKTICALTALMVLTGAGEAVASSDALFQGYQSYNTEERLGWYSLEEDGSTEWIWTDSNGSKGIPMVAGWLRDGRLCGISSVISEGRIIAYDYVELVPETGEVINTKKLPVGNGQYLDYYEIAAYNPVDGRVYGYGNTANGTEVAFKSSAADMTDTRIIKIVPTSEVCSSLTFNSSTLKLVGFNRQSFVDIDLETGNQTTLYTPTIPSFQYTYTGMAYDSNDGRYYWNMFTSDGSSHLYKVDITDNRLQLITDYSNMTQFSFILSPADEGNPLAPEAPVVDSFDFPGGSLSGSVNMTMPTQRVDGTAVSGELKWELSIDGVKCAEGTAKPGEKVSARLENLTEGAHTFTVTATSGEYTSVRGIGQTYLGFDNPMQPTNVTLEGTTLKWNAVSGGVHGGYVDPAAVTYEISLNGEKQSTTTETTATVTYPADRPYQAYTATVVATANGKSSEGAVSNPYCYGGGIEIPVDYVPDANQQYLFTLVDAKGGDKLWEFDATIGGRECFISPLTETASDSWVFTPPLKADDPATAYEVSIRAALQYDDYDKGYFEVMVGTAPTPEAMVKTVIPATSLYMSTINEYKGVFVPTGELANADRIYVGLRAVSADGGFQMKARRFIVRKSNVSPEAPAAPVILDATAAPKGELKADVKFTFPTEALNGKKLDPQTELSATVTCDLFKSTVKGKPGETATVTVKTNQGNCNLTVFATRDGQNGAEAAIRLFTGIAVPAPIDKLDIKIADDNLSCDITWDVPTETYGGGYLDPEDITYWYCEYNSTLGEYTPVREIGHDNHYVLEAPNKKRLSNINFTIQAASSAGAAPLYTGEKIQLGLPYMLPMEEYFHNPETDKNVLTYSPYTLVTTGENAGTSWAVEDPMTTSVRYETEYGIALIGSGNAGTLGFFQFPKFSTLGMDQVVFNANVFGGSTMPETELWGYSSKHIEPMLIGQVKPAGDGFGDSYITLPAELLDCGWVTLYFNVKYTDPIQKFVMQRFIISKDGNDVEGVIADSAMQPRVRMADGSVEIYGFDGDATVCTADGLLVWKGSVSLDAPARVALPAGLYIVSGANTALKVLVR